MNTKLRVDQSKLDKVSHILKTVAHPVRIGIIDLLDQNEELAVTDIYKSLGEEQSAVSHHLTKMKDKQLLSSRRQGKQIFYALKEKQIVGIIDCINGCNV